MGPERKGKAKGQRKAKQVACRLQILTTFWRGRGHQMAKGIGYEGEEEGDSRGESRTHCKGPS